MLLLLLLKEGKDKVSLVTNTYLAYYSTDDYYLQLFGLLTLFAGTSIVRLIPALLSFSVKKFKNHNLVYYKFLRIFRLSYPKVKFTITFISFIFILNEGLSMVNEFKCKSNHPNKTSVSIFVSEPFSLVACIPIIFAFFWQKGNNSEILKKYDFEYIEYRTRNILKT